MPDFSGSDFNPADFGVPLMPGPGPAPPPPLFSPSTPSGPVHAMSTSGTTNFSPSIGSLALNAYARCQIRRTELTTQHMDDVFFETNLLQSAWAADGIIWWSVILVQQPLTQGQASWLVPSNAVSLLDVYINNGSSNRLIFPMSRTDYASLATPTQQGSPTTFWWDRLIPSTITLWPVPDGNATYTMNYYIYTQLQDAVAAGGGNANVPYFWLDAYVAELAYRLARIYAPALETTRKEDARVAYDKACKQNEPVPLRITPGMSGYFR